MNPEERMNPDEKLLVEGLVSIAAVGDTGIDAVYVWNPRTDKASNLGDYIEATFGSEGNIGLYGPMRITIERLSW